MDKEFNFLGYCPVLNRYIELRIGYLLTQDTCKAYYVKNRISKATCGSHISSCVRCPLFEEAPREIPCSL